MRFRAACLVLFIGAASGLQGDDDYGTLESDWSGDSPNGLYHAMTTEVSDPDLPSRKDADTEVLTIRGPGGRKIRFNIWRVNALAEWSPDSQFLVMTTDSAGGHSPWHFESFVYSVKDRTLRQIDPAVGPVIRPTFTFVSSHRVRMALMPLDGNLDAPRWVEIDLTEKVSVMPKVKEAN